MTLKADFAKQFGIANAKAIEEAGAYNPGPERLLGKLDDREPDVKFALSIKYCMTYRCFEEEKFRDFHGFDFDPDELDQWIIDTHYTRKELLDNEKNFLLSLQAD